MAVPKQHRSKSRQGQRRMHLFLKRPTTVTCPTCGAAAEPHRVCHNCGHYKKREVVNVLQKLDKKERKQREKEIAAQEKQQEAAQPLDAGELSKRS